MGGKTAKSTSAVSIPPEVMARYNAVNTRAEGLADTPFKQYSQDPNAFVAGLTGTQIQGIQQAGGYAQAAQPYYQQGAGMTLQAGREGQAATQAAYQPLMQGYGQGQAYNAAAQGLYQQAGQTANPYFTNTQNQIQSGLQQGQGLGALALQQGLGAQGAAQPYNQMAGAGIQAGLAAAQPYNQLATGAALAGSQAVNPEQFSQQGISQYMSPFMSNVVQQTMAAQNQQNAQQRQALSGDAIRAGAFGGDRAGIAQANLAYQQNLANQQTLANLMQSGYGQALGAFQQQQGVNLAAQQANRAAQQNLANQALQIGQQGYGQQMGAAQQAAALGQQLYGQQMGTAGFTQGLGQQGFQQNLAAAQANQGLGSALAGINFQQAQGMQGLGQQAYGMGQGTAAQQAALAQQGYGMGMGAAQGYANMGAGAQNAALQGAQAAIQAGTLEQQTNQAGKSALYNQFLQEQSYPFQVAQFLANIAMGTGALSGSTTTTTQQAPFFSDERVKKDIEPIGETYDGQKIVKFAYKGSPQKQIGLIAQDVEKHHPEAVGLAGGIKTVNYDEATKEAAQRGKDSAGGVVVPFEDGIGRNKYAMGGSSSFDQDFVKQLLANQAGQYAEMYGQPGTPRGAKGTPGAASRVPAATLPVGRVATASPSSKQPEPIVSQGLGAARQGQEIASMLKSGKEGLKYITGGTDEKGNKIPSLADRARAFGQPEQGPPMPGKTADLGSDVKVTVADIGANPDSNDLMKALSGLDKDTAATGGRIKRDLGGKTEEDITAPEGLYAPKGEGLNIPDESQKNKLEPAKPPSGGTGKSGFENTLDAVKTAAKIAAMFMAKDGGAIKKAGGGGAGLKEGLVPLAGEVSSPEEEEKKKELIQLAKADAASKTDATPTGVAPAPKKEEPDLDELFKKNILRLESRGQHRNPDGSVKRSPKGAIGIAQVMPDTAPEAAKMAGLPWDPDRYINDEAYNEALGNAYYKNMYAKYKDPVVAAAAYNAGPGRVDKAIAKSQQTGQPYTNFLPAETQKYVANFGSGTNVNQVATGEVPAAAVPGVAGPGRGAIDAGSAPYSTIIKGLLPEGTSQKTADIATSENFWVPLIAGVGTMLSSKSPYLASAIGEGLVGATGAYTGLNKQQADIAATKAGTEKTFADLVKESVFTDQSGRTWFRYMLPGGGYGIMSIADYVDLPDSAKPKLDPRIEKVVTDAAQQEIAKRAKPAGAPAGAPAAPATGVEPPKPVESAPIAPVTETGAPATAAPAAPAAPAATTSYVQLSPELQKKYADKGRQLFAGGSQMAGDQPDVFTPQMKVAQGANNQRGQIAELATALAASPRSKSLLASGEAQKYLQPLALTLNGYAAAIGIPAVIDPKDAANAEAVQKAVNMLKTAAAKEGNQNAFAALEQFGATLPSKLNSPQGQAQLLAQVYYNNQREIDKQNYYSQILKAAGGEKGQYAQYAMRAGLEADSDFNKEYSQAKYAKEIKSLERMFNEGPKGMTANGRPVTWMEFLNKEGASLSPKEKQQIENQFGKGILRYFGVQ